MLTRDLIVYMLTVQSRIRIRTIKAVCLVKASQYAIQGENKNQ